MADQKTKAASRARTHLVDAVVLLAMSLWATWPWLTSTREGFAFHDTVFTQVSMHHFQEVLLRGADWTAAPMGWPLNGTTQADWTPIQGLIALPLRALGLGPDGWYRVVSWLGLVLTAYAVYRVAVHLVGRGLPAWLAAAGGGFSALHLVHVRHVNLIWHAPALLAAVLGWRSLERRSLWMAALAGLVGALCFHLGFYMGLHAMLLVGVTVAVGAVVHRPGPGAPLAVVAGGIAGLTTVLPVAALYRQTLRTYGAHLSTTVLQHESADLAALVLPNFKVAWHPASPLALERAVDSPNPGYVLLLLGIFGLVVVLRSRQRHPGWWAVLAVGVVSLGLALGPAPRFADIPLGIPGPLALLSWVPGLDGLRAPVRWLLVGHMAVGLFAAAGLAWLVQRLPRAWGLGLGLVLLALVLLEQPGAALGSLRHLQRADPTATRLAELSEPGAVLAISRRRRGLGPMRSLAAVMEHGHPLAGGEYARRLEPLVLFTRLAQTWPVPEAELLLRWTGVRFVILRGELPPPTADCERIGADHLCRLPDPVYPLPPPASTAGDGPIVGVRLHHRELESVVVGCRGEAPETSSVHSWDVLSHLRLTRDVEVFLDTPCAAGLEVAPLDAIPLYAGPEWSSERAP